MATENSYLKDPLLKRSGIWVDYNGPDTNVKTVTGEGDDKKVKYNWGAIGKNVAGNFGRIGGTVMSFAKDKETANNSINDYATNLRKTFLQMAMASGNPYLMAASAISTLSDKVGGTASATKGLGLGNDIGNFMASQVPFLGFLGRKMDKQFLSDELSGSSMYSWSDVADGLDGNIVVGASKAEKLKAKNNIQRSTATNKLRDAKLDFIGALDPRYYLAAQNELNKDLRYVAKNGAVLQFTKRTLSKSKIKKLLDSKPAVLTNYLKNIDEFKEGGKVNVIPEGALHAHKHHLTEKAEDGEKFEDVTTKGIPVVVEDEKGNLIQQAEVEKEEIIFRLEITKKLEELSKKHTDEAAIEAGKLLVFEILHNTIDKTNNML